MSSLLPDRSKNFPAKTCKKNERRLLRRRLRKRIGHVISAVLTIAFFRSMPVGIAHAVEIVDPKKVSHSARLVKKTKSILKFSGKLIINCIVYGGVIVGCCESYKQLPGCAIVVAFSMLIEFCRTLVE